MNCVFIGLILAISICFTDSSQAMYGDLLPMQIAPNEACKIELGDGEVCSGTAIARNVIKTAAHCLFGKVSERILVTCPGHEPVQPRRLEIHDDYNKMNDKRPVDVGLLFFDEPVSISFGSATWEIEEINRLLMNSQLCAIWSYGVSLKNLHDVGQFHGVAIKKFIVENHSIVLKGNAELWILESDSGGGLYCLDSRNVWINIGTVYGHNFKDSFVVRNDGVKQFIEKHVDLTDIATHGEPTMVKTSDLQYSKLLSVVDENKKYKIRPFSILEINNSQRGIGDRTDAQILVKEIKATTVKGLLLFGQKDLIRYYCDGIILCTTEYKNELIEIPTNRLITDSTDVTY